MPMLVFDGYYESAKWLTTASYPNEICYEVEESSALAEKVRQYAPYFTLIVENGILIDVVQREKTPEEIEEENRPRPKTEIELLREKNAQLEATLALQNESNSSFMEFVLQTLGVE